MYLINKTENFSRTEKGIKMKFGGERFVSGDILDGSILIIGQKFLQLHLPAFCPFWGDFEKNY